MADELQTISELAAERFFGRIAQIDTFPDRLSPADAASAVLCALARRLHGGPELDEVVRSLPRSLAALVRRCSRHEYAEDGEVFDRPEFVEAVAEDLGISIDDAEDASRAVFLALGEWLPPDVAQAAERRLPTPLKDLFRGRT